MLAHLDVPAIVIGNDTPGPHASLGVYGISETVNTSTAALLTYVVHHAASKRIRELPITLGKLQQIGSRPKDYN